MAIKLGKPNFFGVAILCAIALMLSFFVDMPALADTLLPQVTSTPTLGSKITLEKEPTSAPTSISTPSVISPITITTPTKHPLIYIRPLAKIAPDGLIRHPTRVIFSGGIGVDACLRI